MSEMGLSRLGIPRDGKSEVGAVRVTITAVSPDPHLAGGDDRFAWARGVLGVALLHAVGRDESDVKRAVHVGTGDRLVVARNRPGEWLLGVGD